MTNIWIVLVALTLPLGQIYAQQFKESIITKVGIDLDTPGNVGPGFSPRYDVIPQGLIPQWTFVSDGGTHSVVESTFDNPCTPLDGGFNSGVLNSSSAQPDLNNRNISFNPPLSQLRDGASFWFFDQASGDCEKGAVFALSFNDNQTLFDVFKAKAMGSSSSTGGGNNTESEGGKNANNGAPISLGQIEFGSLVLLLVVSVSMPAWSV